MRKTLAIIMLLIVSALVFGCAKDQKTDTESTAVSNDAEIDTLAKDIENLNEDFDIEGELAELESLDKDLDGLI